MHGRNYIRCVATKFVNEIGKPQRKTCIQFFFMIIGNKNYNTFHRVRVVIYSFRKFLKRPLAWMWYLVTVIIIVLGSF